MVKIARRVQPFKGSGMNSPQFPGTQTGKTMEQVREFNKNMVRRKGFRFSGGTSPANFQLKISGTSKFLLGIVFLSDSFGVCQMTINNEVVFDDTDTGFFTLGRTNQDYYAINRPLSGQDDVTLNITGDAAYSNKSFVVYYY